MSKSKLRVSHIDALLDSGINDGNVTIQLLLGDSARRKAFPMEIEPALVPSIVYALNANLSQARKLWPDKVKAGHGYVVTHRMKTIVQESGSVLVAFDLEGGLDFTFELKLGDAPQTSEALRALADALAK